MITFREKNVSRMADSFAGNHAQALALAAYTFDVPSFIVMPTISTPSKIAGTRQYTKNVFFSGSTHQEREAKVAEVVAQTGAIVVPPYDHPDILLGQGTVGLEIQQQHYQLSQSRRSLNSSNGQSQIRPQGSDEETSLRAVVAPIGGGGLLGGIATYFSQDPSDSPASMESAMKTYVFGAEPSFQGADDARRGLLPDPPRRIEYVKSLTIADGLRTPVGVLNWTVVSDKRKVEGVYAVTEQQIKETMRLVLERMKLVVEPSGCVALAVVLFNEEWRRWVADMQRTEALKMGLSDRRHISWDVAVVFSGGNTTAEAIGKLFDKEKEEKGEKVEGNVSRNDSKSVEEVAG